MAHTMSPTSSPPYSPPSVSSPASNPNHPALPPLITSPPSSGRRTTLQRPSSHASKNRMSQYSNISGYGRSRPPSHVFPVFHSSLPYTNVRDFAYPTLHPMHYGPPPEPSRPPSGASTPASESQRRLSDPPTPWDTRGSTWGDSSFKGELLAPIHLGDGPPWSEDEDLQSPVVVSSRHRKHKSSGSGFRSGRGRGREPREDIGLRRSSSLLSQESFDSDRAIYAGTRQDGSERYYVGQGDEADGPGGEFVTYPREQARHQGLAPYNVPGQRDSHFAGTLPSRSYTDAQDEPSDDGTSSSASSPGLARHDESRYSRDYQFTIASPDEEMHGKAVALFDFERENENELPLVEGQIIWVSYRHGQGWLVAEDPKTQESGLVPEEYVRLLRDIQGGLNGLETDNPIPSPLPYGSADSGTPTQAEHLGIHNSNSGPNLQSFHSHTPTASNGSNGYQQPIVSTFSTSSRDLNPYPQHLLGTKEGQTPPQVVHYHGQRGGSQANTPTLASSEDNVFGRRGSEDSRGKSAINGSPERPKTGLREEVTSPVSVSSVASSEEGEEDEES